MSFQPWTLQFRWAVCQVPCFITFLAWCIHQHKQGAYGIRGTANLRSTSYLSNQKQCVEINYEVSTKKICGICISDLNEIKHGTPQVSILDPILFILYINHFPINTQGIESVLFADGTDILIDAENENIPNQKINRIMKELQTWSHANDLVINTLKTTAMSFYTWQNKSFLTQN